nr:EOG090X05NZ [Polyphemus pediculus]
MNVRGISSKTMRHRLEMAPKPAPFPYKEKEYNFIRALFDHPTPSRLDDNSKLIVIDGPPNAGKAVLAKELAEELDMVFMEPPTMAKTYINEYGFDLRQLNDELPKDCRSFEEKDFLKNPRHVKARRMQLTLFTLRYRQYLEALAHILNTGQGVILNRSPYSDYVFCEAMVAQGFADKTFQSFYYRLKNTGMHLLWHPHLVIYLDVPVSELLKRIEARNRPNEKNSPASSPEFFQSLENFYKKDYLKMISDHSEVLVYDWTVPTDAEIVVEDVERIDFDKHDIQKLWLPKDLLTKPSRAFTTGSRILGCTFCGTLIWLFIWMSLPEFFQSLENFYKKDYLKMISDHSEVLVYDWTVPTDAEIVVEDVERIDFDKHDIHDLKLKDWRRFDDADWNQHRRIFTTKQDLLVRALDIPAVSCPDLMMDGEDIKEYERIVLNAPGNKYAKGYNTDMGDKGVLFKL